MDFASVVIIIALRKELKDKINQMIFLMGVKKKV
jgi:hypothetical protein